MCFCIEIQHTNDRLLAEDSVADAEDREDSDPGMPGREPDDDELDDEERQIAAGLPSLSKVASRVENAASVSESLPDSHALILS